MAYAGEQVVKQVLVAIVGVVVARHLGPTKLGLLAYGIAIYSIISPVSALGLPAILVRDFTIKQDWRPLLATSLMLQVPMAFAGASAAFILLISTRSYDRDAIFIALSLFPMPIFLISQTFRSFHESQGNASRIVVAGVAGTTTSSVIKIAAVASAAPIWMFSLASALEAGVAAWILLAGVRAKKRIHLVRKYASLTVARRLLAESWPLLVSGLAVTVYMRIDIVMLGAMAGDSATGIYTAAVRISEVAYVLPMAALAAVRPVFSSLHAEKSVSDYFTALQRFLTISAVASYLAIGAVLALGPALIQLVYGDAYAQSGTVLRLHIFALPFVFLHLASTPWFIDNRRGHLLLRKSLVGAGLNIALNAGLIPEFGANGAAVSTLISYGVSGILVNAVSPPARVVLRMQLRALVIRWRP